MPPVHHVRQWVFGPWFLSQPSNLTPLLLLAPRQVPGSRHRTVRDTQREEDEGAAPADATGEEAGQAAAGVGSGSSLAVKGVTQHARRRKERRLASQTRHGHPSSSSPGHDRGHRRGRHGEEGDGEVFECGEGDWSGWSLVVVERDVIL